MKESTIYEVATSLLNGNLSDVRTTINKMSKKDLLFFVCTIVDSNIEPTHSAAIGRINRLMGWE
jgi:hypothetical protein